MTADQLQKILDELGQRLTPGAGHVWEVLVRQQVIVPLVMLGVGAVLLLVAVLCTLGLCLVWRSMDEKERRDDDGMTVLMCVGVWVAWLIGLVGWMVFFLPSLLNPEYGALKDILHSITGS